MLITIDGKVGTGKSTVAQKLARALGFIYFDTGAMYRALTWAILEHQIDYKNPEILAEFLKNFNFRIKIRQGEKFYYVNDKDITLPIRGEAVTSKVSEIAAIPAVREKLVTLQRELSTGVNAIFEGRDMGTVVFPHANLKIFLTAEPQVRAQRRFDELKRKFPEETANLSLEKMLEDINKRDEYDCNREFSPLKQAEDAFLIDTSNLDLEDVVAKILECKDQLKTRK